MIKTTKKMFKTQFTNSSCVLVLEMSQSGEGADCVIEVMQQQTDEDGKPLDKKEFNVHKFVLIVNSDVFRAMFSHKSTKESLESRIQIKDSTASAVHQMLIYLYTGTLARGEYAVEKDGIPLLKIAHKYHIKALMDFNVQQLADSLSLKNVFDCLEMADLCQIHSLKSSCGQLIRRNLSTLKTKANWIALKQKSPELALSILEEFADECVHKAEQQQPGPQLVQKQLQLVHQIIRDKNCKWIKLMNGNACLLIITCICFLMITYVIDFMSGRSWTLLN